MNVMRIIIHIHMYIRHYHYIIWFEIIKETLTRRRWCGEYRESLMMEIFNDVILWNVTSIHFSSFSYMFKWLHNEHMDNHIQCMYKIFSYTIGDKRRKYWNFISCFSNLMLCNCGITIGFFCFHDNLIFQYLITKSFLFIMGDRGCAIILTV